jgi:hypothetical protein
LLGLYEIVVEMLRFALSYRIAAIHEVEKVLRRRPLFLKFLEFLQDFLSEIPQYRFDVTELRPSCRQLIEIQGQALVLMGDQQERDHQSPRESDYECRPLVILLGFLAFVPDRNHAE